MLIAKTGIDKFIELLKRMAASASTVVLLICAII
jgi:hypothetical protein